MAEENKKDWNAPLDLRKLENKIEREQSEGRERTKDIQPPIDGITIESIGSDVALVIRSRITDAEVEVLKNWMKENKGELVMAGRYNITKISISPANNIKIRLDNSLAKALDSIGTISNLEYRSGRLEVDPNYTSNPLLDFKNLDHVHVWGGGLALEFERNGRVINPYNETHGLSFSFGTSDGKYKEDQKIFTARTTEISGLSGIDASSFIQTGGGAALLKENAASKNHVDLSTEYREDSLHHAEDARATETTFVKALDYRNTIKNLLLIPKEDWAKIVTEKEEGLKDPAFSMWMDINTPEGMVLDYFARAQGFENSSLLLSDMAESLSKDIILQENVAPVVDFLNDRKRTIDLKRLEGLLEGDEDKQIESLGEIGTRNFLNKITNESFMSYREKALGEEERKKRAERKASKNGSRDSGGTETAENIPEDTPGPEAGTVEDTAENTLDSGSASDEERENGVNAPENAENTTKETVTADGPAIETSVPESPVLETSARDDGNSKNDEKPEETKGDAKDTASYGPHSIDNFVNTDKILWKQKIEDLDDFLYTRYENGEVKEQLVKKLSDRETYLESNERDLNYKKKAIGGVYNTNDLKTRNEEIDLKLDKAKRNYKEKLDRYNALTNESDKDQLKSDEINPLEKEIKSLSQQKTFIYNQMADSLKIGLEQGRKIALAIYEEFETARQMDNEAVGKYIVSNGSMSFNEASLAGEKKEIINNKVDMDKMIISSARLLMAEGVELRNNIQLSEEDRELFNELKEKASKDGQELNEAEKSSLYKFELREKAKKSLTSDGTGELLTSFIEKYNETIENRKAVESLFCNKYSMFPSTASITSCRKTLETDPEILEAQDKYEKSIADLKETALSFTDKTDSFFKSVRDTSEPENVEKNLYILSGKDGYLEEKDGLLLPMDMFNRAKFFKALTENSGKNNTLLFGQGSSFKYGALSGTGINAIIEKTDFVYEERYNAEKAAREKENADLRETLNSMLFHATGKKDLSSKSLTIEDWENHIRNVFENNPDAAKTALTDIKRKMTAIEKNQAWLNTNCSLDDYITLQSVRGLELKNIWDEKITERSAAYAQNLPTEEINKIVKECTKAQQDYEDFKKDRKTELCTGFAKNAEINIESGNFKFSGKNVNEGNTAEIIDLQKREGSTYEFVGDDDEAEGISGSKYRAAKWRMLKNRVRGVVFDAISSFSRMSVIESILQVLLMLALMTHQLIKRPAEYFKYQFKSIVADDATAERALLGLALENAFDTEKDENGKVIGLIIKDEFREKANHSGVTLSEDGRHFNVDISKATDGKFSGRRVFSFSAIPQTEDTEVIKRRMETLKKREEDARNFTNAYENAQVEKKNKIIQTVAIMEAEAKEAQEINNSYRKQGLIGSDGITPKDKMKMKDKKITGNIHRTKSSSPVR